MSDLDYMEKLLDGVEVEWKMLGELADNLDSMRKPITGGLREPGSIPYYGASGIVDYVKDYIFDGDYLLVSEDGANLLARNTPIAFSISGKNWVNNHAHVLRFENYSERRYIEHYLNSIDLTPYISGAAQPKLNQKNLNSIIIPVPPLSIQADIVRILDTFTELTAELTAELVARKQQYTYYRKQLMNIDVNSVGVKQMSLGEIYHFQYGKGNTIPKTGGEYPVYGSNGIVGSHHEYNSEDAPVIGHIGAYAGIVNWGKGKHFVTYNGVICRMKSEEVLPQYAYYILLLQNFGEKSNSASQPFVSYHILEAPVVPIPPISEQQRIVTILDKFDALTTSLTEGLPREIALRQQQYEYYRELLLSFPKPEVANHD